MTSPPRITRRNLLRIILLAIFPWLPAYLFERIDFYFGISGNIYWYYQLSGTRLEADVVSFALGGILVAYLLRPRWAVIQVFLSAALIWTLFYEACSTFRTGGLLHSGCYQTGPDGLAGFRLMAMMFSFGALPAIVKAASKRDALNRTVRPAIALAGGIVITVVMAWFPLTAWFSGVTYLSTLVVFQGLILAGVPQMATGMLAARIGRSLKIAASSGVVSLLALSAGLWTLVAYGFWDPRVLYASSISPTRADLTLGQSSYPYVAGYYNSTQYRICCLQLGVSFVEANVQLLAPDNFLMAGMGVQSPNCCVDGWDLGWRADVFLLPNRSLIVSGSSWTTCDSNANCGGYFWQQLRYHAQVTLNPQEISAPIYLRMMWE